MKFNDSFFDEVNALSQMGKEKDALKMLNMVPEDHFQYSKALLYKSMILKDEEGISESWDLLKKAIDNRYLNKLSSQNVEDVFETAIDYFDDGAFEMAIELFDVCIRKNYNLVDSFNFKSQSLINLGLYEDANLCVDKGLEIDDNNIELIQSKSRIIEALGDYNESLQWIDKAIELDPDCIESYHIKAIILFQMEKYEESFKYIDKYPNDIDGLLLKSKFYNRLGDYENMDKCLEAAEKIDGNNIDVLFFRMLCYFEYDDFENANKYVDKCLKIDPGSWLLLNIKLEIVQELDDSDLLEETLNDIYQSNPEFIDSMLNNDTTPIHNGLNEDSSKYALEDLRYGKEYPSQSFNYNMYIVMSALKSDSNISNVYSNIELTGSYSCESITEVLMDENFIQPLNLDDINVEKEALSKSPQILSKLLKDEGITASGKKKKLVKLAVKNVPPIKFCSNYTLTVEGEEFLNEYSWFEAYGKTMECFDLNDVGKYIEDHDENNLMELLVDYIDEHIDLAHQNENFEYLDDCLISKSLLCCYQNDYDNCLHTSLTELILKLNPIYEYELFYALYRAFNSFIIENISKSLQILDIDIESLFYEIWDLKDSEKDFISKEKGFNYLKRALDGEDLNDLSVEYEEKYIQVIYRD